MPNLPTTPIAMKTTGLHHIGLRTADVERAKRFYAEILGLPLMLETPTFLVFLAGTSLIGIIGPTEKTPKGDAFDPFRVGMDHAALACPSKVELQRVAEALTAAGIKNTGLKTEKILDQQFEYVAFWDPDGIKWEFYMPGEPQR